MTSALFSSAANIDLSIPQLLPEPRQKLTTRQKQFWEDIEEGLRDVKRAKNIDPDEDLPRINSFVNAAQFKTTPPQPLGPRHDPCEEFIPGLTAMPWWDDVEEEEAARLFPWKAELESKSEIIIDEFFSVMERDKVDNAEERAKRKELKAMYDIRDTSARDLFSSDSAWQNEVMGGGWSAVRLQRLGEWNVENCARFPKTYELIRSLDIPLAVRGVCFAKQGPNTGVAEHSDGRNFILTSHLALKIPDGEVSMTVGESKRGWIEGKVCTIDTSFTHSTVNKSSGDRYVLIIDFWHPELTSIERGSLEYIYDLRNKFERGDVPVRKLKKKYDDEREPEGGGLGAIWNLVTGGKK
ncbi:hypothetical protein TrCOL_g2306 [Triparma columacea]|uniref:Aspartyl/asparaginy/proline hydroxylase domain-containing protein n=1 Tax=Triparma columacea TaxID=722753 RepID=A0A9W7G0L3_9STRA|nr:hypothetical protein TrCOL_g2306 [Triparma columacea]